MQVNRSDIDKILRQNYRLTTAEIIYHMPDYYHLLQSYVWQELDLAPDFPVLKEFLDFWEKSLDGKLHSVNVASCEIIKPAQFTYSNDLMYIN